MRNKIIYSCLSLMCCIKLLAQDPQFTQFYASPLFLNPAFTGLTYEHRFALNYRNQWPGIKNAFSTYMGSYDYNINNLNSGIGVFALQDRAGSSNLVTTQFGGNFAYRIKINKFSEVRGGVTTSMVQKKVDNQNLIFNDQLASGNPVTSNGRGIEKVSYMDMGVGALYNSPTYWFGIAAKHINSPNVSLIGNTEVLPTYITVHGGYRYIISARGAGKTKLEEFVSLSGNYRHENKYDQLDIGAYYFKSMFNVGLWYRGLPIKRYKPGYPNRETIAILIGLEIPEKSLKVGYSYDITVSKLGLGNTFGAHEITLVYEIAKKKRRNKRVLVSCPKF